MAQKGIKKGVLKTIFASTLLSIVSHQTMASPSVTVAYDNWLQSQTETQNIVYPSQPENTAYRDQVSVAYDSGKAELLPAILEQLSPVDSEKIDIMLFYALKHGDFTTIEKLISKVEQDPEQLLNLAEHAETLERYDMLLDTLKRIETDKTLAVGHLLGNSGYIGNLDVAEYVIDNFAYSDNDLAQALQDAEVSGHNRYMLRVLKKAEANPENDLGHLLENLSYKGEETLGKLIVQKFGYQAEDLSSAVNNAVLAGHVKYATVLLSYAKTDPSNDMGFVLENASQQSADKIAKLIVKKFGYQSSEFKKAVSNAMNSRDVTFVETLLREAKENKAINLGDVLEQAATRGHVKIARTLVDKFAYTPENLKTSLLNASDNNHYKFMYTILKRAEENKMLDMSDILLTTSETGDYQTAVLLVEKFKVSQDSVLKSLQSAYMRHHKQYVTRIKSAAHKHLSAQSTQASLAKKIPSLKVG